MSEPFAAAMGSPRSRGRACRKTAACKTAVEELALLEEIGAIGAGAITQYLRKVLIQC